MTLNMDFRGRSQSQREYFTQSDFCFQAPMSRNELKTPQSSHNRQSSGKTLPKPNRPALTLLLELNYVIGGECSRNATSVPVCSFP